MPSSRPEVLHHGGDQLGECPVWDERRGVLYRVDGVGGAVLAVDVTTGAERRFDLGRHIGSVVPRQDDDGLLVAAHGGFYALDLRTGDLTRLAAVAEDQPDLLMNDGKCDPLGRFLAGTMHRDGRPGHGGLFRYDPRRRTAVSLLQGVGVSNGLAWDRAGTSLYYIDSLLGRVDRLRYDLERGAVTSREPAFELPPHLGMPDGMAIDAQDHLWITFWRGGAVRRFTAAGRQVAEVTLPVLRTTSCCLGGDDMRDLFVTTARRSIRQVAADVEPLAGAVFRCRVDVPGVPASRWRPDS